MSVVWLFQMNEEQRRVALFQAQPEGLGRIFRPTALPFAYVEQLHRAHGALLDEKCGSSSGGNELSTDPSGPYKTQQVLITWIANATLKICNSHH